MKKKYLLILLALVLMVALAACGGETEGSSPAAEPPAQTTEPPTTVVDENAALDAYNSGMECFYWMKFGNLIYDYNDSYEDGNYTYYKVRDYETLADLQAYFSSLFAEDIVNDLLNSATTLTEQNGKLYGLDGARGANIQYGDVTTAAEKISDAKYVVTATVNVLADDGETVTGTESYEYPYEQQADGSWIFTAFPFYL